MGLLTGVLLLQSAGGLLLGLLLVLLYGAALRPPTIRGGGGGGAAVRWAPDALPVAGHGLLFLQARQRLFAWFVRCEQTFPGATLRVSVPTLPPGVLVSDPRNLDFVFRSEGALVSKGAFVKGMLGDLFGRGIVNADGDGWRVQRKAGLAFLSAANIRVLTDVALPRYLAAAVQSLRADAAARRPVDLQAVLHELTSRLMGKMAYNMEMHADDAFSLAFDLASGVTTERFQNPLWFLTEYLTPRGADLRRAIVVVKAFGRRIVATAVADRQTQHGHARTAAAAASTDKVDEVSGSLIQSLLDAIADPDVVADAALNYLSAGRDTVAQALTWTFYMLMQHPRVVDTMRAEVASVLASDDDATAPDYARFTPAALPYTMAVFYEGLRLFPPIPFEIKQVDAPAGLVLPDGTALPRGALVIWCAWAMNRSRQTWGPDADDFRPDRWLTPDGRLLHRSPAEFPVFHGGPRTCLGKKMAEGVAVQALAAIVHFFDLRPVGGDPAAERFTKTSLTLPMEDGLPCYVEAR